MSLVRRIYAFLKQRPVRTGAVALTMGLATASIISAQTGALDRVMRQKLEHSQAILAAVVTSNWPELQRHSQALVALTADSAWMAMKTPDYATQSQAFVRAAQELVDAAKRRDLDETPGAYMALTLRCVACHRYVARTRFAGYRTAASHEP